MGGLRLTILIVLVIMIIGIIIFRQKIHVYILIVVSENGCYAEGNVRWMRIPFIKKEGNINLDRLLNKAEEVKEDIPKDGPEWYQEIYFNKMKERMMIFLDHCASVKLNTEITFGVESPVMTAMITGFIYILRSFSLVLARQLPTLTTSFKIHPQFQSPDINLRIESMIDILPGQAIHIILHMLRAGRSSS